MSDLLKVSGLWLNKKESGEVYMTGSWGNFNLVIFKNSFKEDGSNQPDYNLYLSEKQRNEEAEGEAPRGSDIPF